MSSTRAASGTQLGRDLVAGVAVGALEIIMAASFTLLIFGAALPSAVPRAVSVIIVATGVSVLLSSRLSKARGVIGSVQDAPAVVLSAMVASVVADVGADAAEATVFSMILVAGVAVGLSFVIVGRFGLVASARSLPFTVVTGFMAGTGWLLCRAGAEVALDTTLDWGGLIDVLEWDQLRLLLPAAALAVLAVVAERRDQTGLVFPAAIIGLAAGIHLIGGLGWSLDEMRDAGWLLGPFPEAEGWAPVTPSDLRDADWGAIAGQALPLLGLIGVSVVSMVLCVTAVEVGTEEDLVLEDEVVGAGVGSTASSLLSGIPCFHQLSGTFMARQMGSRTPTAAVVVFVLCLTIGFAGMDALALMPRSVAGGVLLAVGLSMLVAWVQQIRHQLSPLEAATSAIILGSIIAFGVLTGIGVGILAAVLGFVFNYSRVEPIRRVHQLGTSRSAVDRPRTERRALEESTDAMVAVELVGYLFFGSITRVTDMINPMLTRGELRFLIMDFAAVRGLDASVVAGLQTMQRRTAAADVELVWCGLTPAFEAELRRGGAEIDRHYLDLDHALEYVEERVLADSRPPAEDDAPPDPETGDTALLNMLAEHCEVLVLDTGDPLIEVGDAPDEMYLVRSGTLTAWGVEERGHRVRLRRVGVGSILGEVAFISGGERTALVTADGPATVLRLSADLFDSICTEHPELGVAIQAELAKRLAERLSYTSAAYQRAIHG